MATTGVNAAAQAAYNAGFRGQALVTAVAIAGAESSFGTDSLGDYGYGGPTCGDGSTSWGMWQVHNVHGDELTQWTGSSDPCTWKSWLMNPTNCAKAAYAISSSGTNFYPWTTYSTGAYRNYLSQAQQAVNNLSSSQSTPPSQTVSYFTTQSFTWGVLLVGSMLAIGYAAFKLGYIEEVKHKWKHNRYNL